MSVFNDCILERFSFHSKCIFKYTTVAVFIVLFTTGLILLSAVPLLWKNKLKLRGVAVSEETGMHMFCLYVTFSCS